MYRRRSSCFVAKVRIVSLGNVSANRDAVKWNAAKTVAECLNINTESFVVFGEDYNDLEMLMKCGIGVAVKSAIDKVRFAAKYICETNDNDGDAKWIEEHVL